MLLSVPEADSSRLRRKLRYASALVANELILAVEIIRRRPNFVLLDSFREYLSPIWIWPHLLLAKLFDIRYAANLQDPIRDYQLGPRWWHLISVKLAYSRLRLIFVHQQLHSSDLVPSHIRVIETPHGGYEIRPSRTNVADLRKRWGAAPDQQIFLCFGYLRDNKRIDLLLRAMVHFANSFAVILGRQASENDRGISCYRRLAAKLGIQARTHMSDEFVPDEQIEAVFQASDFAALLYSRSFVSESAVAHIAARLRRRMLVSAGDGPLRKLLADYGLGVFVEPDDLTEACRGMEALLSGKVASPRWADYDKELSWDKNAQAVTSAFLQEIRRSSQKPGAGEDSCTPVPR